MQSMYAGMHAMLQDLTSYINVDAVDTYKQKYAHYALNSLFVMSMQPMQSNYNIDPNIKYLNYIKLWLKALNYNKIWKNTSN